jgi:hypothetical protein
MKDGYKVIDMDTHVNLWGQKTHTALPQPICIGAAFFHHPPLQSDTHSA